MLAVSLAPLCSAYQLSRPPPVLGVARARPLIALDYETPEQKQAREDAKAAMAAADPSAA